MHHLFSHRPFAVAALSFSLLLGACSGSAPQNAGDSDLPVVQKLEEADIFSGDLVKSFMAQENPPVKEADKLFLEGIDLYRNKKDVTGAVRLLIRSICKFPESRSYYELGNAYMDNGAYAEAIPCFEMAEKLGYEPLSKVLYNLACAHTQTGRYEIAGQYLEFSLQAGYANLDHIAKDEDLAHLRDSADYYYRNALKRGMQGMTNPKALFWLQFRKLFAKVKLPYTLDGEKRMYTDQDHISFDFEKYITEMRDSKFSRDVGASFYAASELYSTDKFIALVYSEEDPYLTDKSPMTYRLVTITPEGKLIDKRVVAGYGDDYFNLKTAVFGKDRSVTVKTFALEYQKDTEKNGFDKNPIKSRTEAGTRVFQINDDGTITEAKTV